MSLGNSLGASDTHNLTLIFSLGMAEMIPTVSVERPLLHFN